MRADLALSIVVMLTGAVALAILPQQIAGYGYDSISDMRSPVVFPAVSAALLMLLGAVLGLGTLARGAATAAGGEGTRPGIRTAAVFVIIVGYVAAVPWIGLPVASFITFLLMSLAFGYRRPLPMVLVAVGTIALVLYLFGHLLLIVFPVPKVTLW
ncbi:tripartite tricarboxylate transporter TctB family protein [Azospirillum sp. RWY-5-1]|uniref:Tripartite tricarboxylate transporter TctB family protein n=1 Tax=Azospirillum oleiclasticum TaxID=2735135 RepID=A0ABX2THB7_9PROT|nr:tripartite tricarboxylate transporter TctB family protein [Azospirillum oleiclasticum]NYZ15530.1 tripartite tricarboxylate transporter TctB family protein [Azospirillum oleiclasticum]NYZ22553.1 tripartite tricarboxylate transporter TctB family protein [Azospirillum oleiclasticum]